MDDQCVVCQRKVQRSENYVRCHLWGAFASFHWNCFSKYLRSESEPQVEDTVWKATSLTKST
jgi:hypothetical protein